MLRHCNRPVQVSAGFCLLTAWFGIANGWALLSIVLGSAAIHELGHCLALRAVGGRILGMRLSILGAVLKTDCTRLSYGRELSVVLAGPAANLLCAVLVTFLGRASSWSLIFTGANLVLCVFNLLPVRPLDGGRALELFVCWLWGPAAGEWTARAVGVVLAAVLAVAIGWLMWRTGGSLWLLPAAVGVWVAGWREGFGK